MKKLLILTLLLSMLLWGCGKEEPTETLSREDLIYGPTSTAPGAADPVTIPEDQEAVTVPPTQAPTHIRVLTRMASLDENGQELWHREYQYDAQGRLATETEINADGTVSCRMDHEYQEGVHTVTYTYASGTTEQVTEFLDERGQVISRKTSCPPEDLPHTVQEYTYDEYGSVLTCRLILDGFESIQSFTYTYSQDGKVLGERETMDGELVAQREYFYDDQGRIAEALYIDGSGSLLYSTLHGWEGSTETVTTLDSQDNVTIVTIHTYDSADGFGNLLRDEIQQDGHIISCAEYTYEDIEISGN